MTARELYENGVSVNGGFRFEDGIWVFCVVGWGWAGNVFLTPTSSLPYGYKHIGHYYFPDTQGNLDAGADEFSVVCDLKFSGTVQVLRQTPSWTVVSIPMHWEKTVDLTQDITNSESIKEKINNAVLDGWGDYIPPNNLSGDAPSELRISYPLAGRHILEYLGDWAIAPTASIFVLPYRHFERVGDTFTSYFFGDIWSLCKVFYSNIVVIEIKGTRVRRRQDEITIHFRSVGDIPLTFTYRWQWLWKKPENLPLSKLVFETATSPLFHPEGVKLNIPLLVTETRLPMMFFRRLCYFCFRNGTPISPVTFFPFFQLRTIGGQERFGYEFLLNHWDVGVDDETISQLTDEMSQFGTFNLELPKEMHHIYCLIKPHLVTAETFQSGKHTYYKYTLVPESSEAIHPFPSNVIPILIPAGGIGTQVESAYSGMTVSSLIRVFLPLPRWWLVFLTDLGGLVTFSSPTLSRVKLSFVLYQYTYETWKNYITPIYSHYYITDKGEEKLPDTRDITKSFYKFNPKMDDYQVRGSQLEVVTPTERRRVDFEQGGELVRWLWRKLP